MSNDELLSQSLKWRSIEECLKYAAWDSPGTSVVFFEMCLWGAVPGSVLLPGTEGCAHLCSEKFSLLLWDLQVTFFCFRWKAPLRWVRAIGMVANGMKEKAKPAAGTAQSCRHPKARCLRNLW